MRRCRSAVGKVPESVHRNMGKAIRFFTQKPKQSMNDSTLDTLFSPVAKRLHANHMEGLGIRNTMRMAHFYNRIKFPRQDNWRHKLYETQLDALLAENGPFTRPRIEMKDGWAIDDSMSLPHLD